MNGCGGGEKTKRTGKMDTEIFEKKKKIRMHKKKKKKKNSCVFSDVENVGFRKGGK